MKFIGMQINNFLSFGEGVDFPFNRRGLTVIVGENRDDPTVRDNGAGKSAIPDALQWCLYGTTSRGLSGDEVVNRTVGKDCFVQLSLDDDAGVRYTITRCRLHSVQKNALTLYRVGVWATYTAKSPPPVSMTGATNAETQAKIAALIGMSAETFIHTVIFGQTPGYRFSMLPDGEQKAVFDDALGMNLYAQAGEIAKADAKHLFVNVLTPLQDEYSDVRTEILAMTARKETAEAAEATFVADKNRRIKVAQKRQAAAESLVRDLLPKAAKAVVTTEAVLEADREKKRLEVLWRGFQTQVSDADSESRRFWAVEAGQRHEADIAVIRGVGECADCGQMITYTAINDHVAKLTRTADDAKVQAERVDSVRVKLINRRDRTRKMVLEAENALCAAQNAATVARDARSALHHAKADATRAAADVKMERAEVSPHVATINKSLKRLGTLTTRSHDLDEKTESVKAKIATLQFWIDAFGNKGVRSLLIDSALPMLNAKAADLSRVLTDGNFTVAFSTLSTLKSGKVVERFAVCAINRYGADCYKGLSAGEKAKVDLIVGLSFQALVASRAKASIPLAFFDEPFEGLDDVAMDRVVELLTDALKTRESIFVITHNEALKAYFPSTITVTKEKGISRIL